MCKRILITGSHGVGKSSMLFQLASQLKQKHRSKNIEIIQENVREIKQLVGSLNTPQFQMAAVADYLLKDTVKSLQSDYLIMDRAAFDVVVYGEFFGTPPNDALKQLAIEQLKSFHQVFFIRPDARHYLADDGFRMTDVKQMRALDDQFDIYFKSFNFKNIITLRTSEIGSYQV